MGTSISTNFKPVRFRSGVIAVLFVVLFSSGIRANAPIPRPEPVKTMPVNLGAFHLVGEAKEYRADGKETSLPELSVSPHLVSTIEASYALADKAPFHVSVFKWDSDSAAFADLTRWSQFNHRELDGMALRVGTASARTDRDLKFFKGPISVVVGHSVENNADGMAELGRELAATLDGGEGEIPVLVKHLPNADSVQSRVAYALTSVELIAMVTNQPVLNELSFDGGTEAVAADYGPAKLVIVEFTTPQFSIDNDSRIWTKIADLKAQGQPTPNAYRRVGNYSVFVFNAPDDKAANALLAQVKYEQVVQWLGDDPHLADRLQRYFTQTSAGVLVAVLKSSGISLVLCLGIGGLVGALLFRHRRAQRAAAFSDAGGSIRLNLDELTGPANTRPLLSTSERSHKDPAS
jgi:hypothetical protein